MDLILLNKICEQYHLGKLLQTPGALTGGFLHQMYSLFTDTGKYTVKLLNPFIMQQENVMESYRTADELERKLEQNGFPIIPALSFQNRKMQHIDGQFFYLYRWYNGKALKAHQIRNFHCVQISRLLARIHGLDSRKQAVAPRELHIDWDAYMEPLLEKHKELFQMLKENRSLLYEMQEKGNLASRKLPPISAICHNDMDPKNVLWMGSDFRVIDLECLCYSSPLIELYETALYWCGYDQCRINFDLLRLFMHAYREAGGQLPADWEIIYDSNNARLEWLDYNLRRASGTGCSLSEISSGVSEAEQALRKLLYYHDARDDIIRALRAF